MAKVERAIRVEALDSNTCGFCDDADGIVVALDSPEYDEYKPPNGCEGADLCRGIYAYIRIDEPIKPLLTPKRKLPKINPAFVPTPVTAQEIKIQDQLDKRMGLTDAELKTILKIDTKEVLVGAKKARLSVDIRLRNGKHIYLYDRVPKTNMVASEQAFIREVIGHFDKGLINLDKVESIILEFKGGGRGLGFFDNTSARVLQMNVKNILKYSDQASIYETLYHEGTHAQFYEWFQNTGFLKEARAGQILDKITDLSESYGNQITKGLAELRTESIYRGYAQEELLARYVGMIKNREFTGKYLKESVDRFGKMTPEIRKILMKEGLL